MSLISTDPTSGLSLDGALPDSYDAAGASGTAGSASGVGSDAAGDASSLVDADASATEGDATPVAEDRSETFRNTDSAYAES